VFGFNAVIFTIDKALKSSIYAGFKALAFKKIIK